MNTENTQTAETQAPFQFQDVVGFIPAMAQEFISQGKRFALVLNCINYGTQDQPNWAVDVQHLKESEYSDTLKLSNVREFMIAAWQVEKVNRPWIR